MMCWKQTLLTPFLTGLCGAMGVYIIAFIREQYKLGRDKRRILLWLSKNTAKKTTLQPNVNEYRTTRMIASYNNLTDDRVRFICSIHPQIRTTRGEEKDIWGLTDILGK